MTKQIALTRYEYTDTHTHTLYFQHIIKETTRLPGLLTNFTLQLCQFYIGCIGFKKYEIVTKG